MPRLTAEVSQFSRIHARASVKRRAGYIKASQPSIKDASLNLRNKIKRLSRNIRRYRDKNIDNGLTWSQRKDVVAYMYNYKKMLYEEIRKELGC